MISKVSYFPCSVIKCVHEFRPKNTCGKTHAPVYKFDYAVRQTFFIVIPSGAYGVQQGASRHHRMLLQRTVRRPPYANFTAQLSCTADRLMHTHGRMHARIIAERTDKQHFDRSSMNPSICYRPFFLKRRRNNKLGPTAKDLHLNFT